MELFYVEAAYPGCLYVEISSPTSAMNFSVRIPDGDRYGLLLKEIGGLIPALMIVDGNLTQGIALDVSDIQLIKKFFDSYKFLELNAKTIELINSLNEVDFHDTSLATSAIASHELAMMPTSQQASSNPS